MDADVNTGLSEGQAGLPFEKSEQMDITGAGSADEDQAGQRGGS